VLFTSTFYAQEITWITLDEALTMQKKFPKPIFMDVYTDWCGPCKQLDKTTFHDPNFVKEINTNYYAVKFNAEGNSIVNYKNKKYSNPEFDASRKGRNAMHEFTQFLKVQGYPTMYVLDEKGEVAKNLIGFRTVDQLFEELKN
jgi:thiol:disulfide interchange protein